MATPATTKFNLPKTTTYIIMPLAFTGKDKRFKGLTNAYQFLLAEIYTANKAVKGFAKLTYDHFEQKFGMSRNTISAGIGSLEERGIIKRLGTSRYQILLKFNTKDYIIIDDYLHKHLWNVGNVQKRFARSRITTLAFLERENSNPKTNGIFKSSQARIGVALNLPRTTAGDTVRELVATELIKTQQADIHAKEAYKRGLTLFTVAPELLKVKRCKPAPPPDETAEVKALFKQHDKKAQKRLERWELMQVACNELEAERKAETLDKQFMQDYVYAELKQRLKTSRSAFITALRHGNDEAQAQSERELETVRNELAAYLKARNVPPDMVAELIK